MLVLLALLSTAQAQVPTVCFEPLGTWDAALLDSAVQGVTTAFGFQARVVPEAPMPPQAWYAPRSRYRAERILAWLDQQLPSWIGCTYAMGFTSLDISTTKDEYPDWGIFGLGTIGGPSAVVSTFRLGHNVSRRQFQERVVKVVNHELGHVLGLDHCPTHACLMEDAAGTVRTVDSETGALCPVCSATLGSRLQLVGTAIP